MWSGVTERFRRFHVALQPSQSEREDAASKCIGIQRSLQRAYWGTSTDNPPGLLVGSWGKRTVIRPPNDVDLFMHLPVETFQRFDGYAGNKQSALLQEVKGQLATTYPQTQMRGDGQVVVVAFNSITVEIVPVFRWDDNGTWLMPDTNGGGRWRRAYPAAEFAVIDNSDAESHYNCRPLIQIIKAWKDHCNVPIKSFHIEQLVADFIRNYQYRDQSYFYYDWFVRDFLSFLISKRHTSIYAPASAEFVSIGDAWLSRAITALERAQIACEHEYQDRISLAGEVWQRVFGLRIPTAIT